MVLTHEEIERYARHIVLPEIGGPGQQLLKKAQVLVIGAGGLGAPLLLYLAAAGIGTIGIVDDDRVGLSNLQRQILFNTGDVGELKTDKAAQALQRLNPHIVVKPYPLRLDAENMAEILTQYDVIADGSDNFETRYAVSDACFVAKKPLVTAALGRFDATLTTIKAHEVNAQGDPLPTLRCLFPAPPPAGTVPACAEAGIIGALAGVMGSLMALEIIRCIVPFGQGLVGRLLMVDARDMRFETLQYSWDPRNPLNGRNG